MKFFEDLRSLDKNNIGGWPQSIKIFFTALLFALIGIALVALLALAISHELTRGLRRLVVGVGRVAAGERGFKLDFTRHDEIGRLGDDFNHMLDAL